MEIAVSGPGGIAVIPGGSGFQELTQLSDSKFAQVISSFNQLDGLADMVLLDTGAGISKDVSNFLLASDEVIIVTTPEPHAVMDAYAIIKVMHNQKCQAKKWLIVNKSESQSEADHVAHKLITVCSQFLHQSLEYAGSISEDKLISKSLKAQSPLMLEYPQSQPASNISDIAAKLLNKRPVHTTGVKGFIDRMLSLFSNKSSGHSNKSIQNV